MKRIEHKKIKDLFDTPPMLEQQTTKNLAERLYNEHKGIDSVATAWELINCLWKCIRQKLHDDGRCRIGGLGELYIHEYEYAYDAVKKLYPHHRMQKLKFMESKKMKIHLGHNKTKKPLLETPKRI